MYKDIWETKGPVYLFLYSLLMKIPFDELTVIFISETLLAISTILIFYKITGLYDLEIKWRIFVTVMAMILCYTEITFVSNGYGQTEEFSFPFLMLIMYLLLKGIKEESKLTISETLLIGIILTVIIFCKYTNIIAVIPIGCVYIFHFKKEKKYIITRLIMGLCGIIFTTGTILIWLYCNGSLSYFMDMYIINNISGYAASFDIKHISYILCIYIMCNIIPLVLCIRGLVKKAVESWCYIACIIIMYMIHVPYTHYYHICNIYIICILCNCIVLMGSKRNNNNILKNILITCVTYSLTALMITAHSISLIDDSAEREIASIIQSSEDNSVYAFTIQGRGLYYLIGSTPELKGYAASPGCMNQQQTDEIIEVINSNKFHYIVSYDIPLDDKKKIEEISPLLAALNTSDYTLIDTYSIQSKDNLYSKQNFNVIYVYERQ